MCVRVCVWETERARENESEKERERACVCVYGMRGRVGEIS